MSPETDYDSYEWDEAKRESNLSKHGIDFLDVALAMQEPHLVAPAHHHGEDRWIALVMLESRLIAGVYTVRDGACRIISARVARKNERKAYDANFSGSASQAGAGSD